MYFCSFSESSRSNQAQEDQTRENDDDVVNNGGSRRFRRRCRRRRFADDDYRAGEGFHRIFGGDGLVGGDRADCQGLQERLEDGAEAKKSRKSLLGGFRRQLRPVQYVVDDVA